MTKRDRFLQPLIEGRRVVALAAGVVTLGSYLQCLARELAVKSCACLAVMTALVLAAPCRGQVRNPVVVMDTSLGLIRLELFADKAPVTVKNFLQYVDDKFYDGTVFHRVIPNFMIQGGGLGADLRDKPARAPIPNEAGNGLANVRGSVAMARTSDPNSATAQFFINTKDNAFLDRARAPDRTGYAVFGKVIDGMDVVEKITRAKTGQRGPHADVPVEAVVIRAVRRATALTLVVGGPVAPGRLFTITAYVDYPGRGEALTLELPPGVELVEGKDIQPVPAPPAGAGVVFWKARASRAGELTVRVRSHGGIVRSQAIHSRAP
jgi:cyclophilin family peptidyl-prolyl cis-trans isomerase